MVSVAAPSDGPRPSAPTALRRPSPPGPAGRRGARPRGRRSASARARARLRLVSLAAIAAGVAAVAMIQLFAPRPSDVDAVLAPPTLGSWPGSAPGASEAFVARPGGKESGSPPPPPPPTARLPAIFRGCVSVEDLRRRRRRGRGEGERAAPSKCVLYEPGRFFEPGMPGHPHLKELNSTLSWNLLPRYDHLRWIYVGDQEESSEGWFKEWFKAGRRTRTERVMSMADAALAAAERGGGLRTADGGRGRAEQAEEEGSEEDGDARGEEEEEEEDMDPGAPRPNRRRGRRHRRRRLLSDQVLRDRRAKREAEREARRRQAQPGDREPTVAGLGIPKKGRRRRKQRPPPPQLEEGELGLTFFNVPKAASTAMQAAFSSAAGEDPALGMVPAGGRPTTLPWEKDPAGAEQAPPPRYKVRYAIEGGCCHRRMPPRQTKSREGEEEEGDDDDDPGPRRRGEAYLRELLRCSSVDRGAARRSGRPPRHVVFAVVRDPVARFVSSVAQVLGMDGAVRRPARAFRDRCRAPFAMEPSSASSTNRTSEAATQGPETTAAATATREERIGALRRSVLRCAVDFLRATNAVHGLDADVHLTPAATRLASYVLPGNRDVAVAVYPLEEVDGILSALGYEAGLREKKKEGTGGERGIEERRRRLAEESVGRDVAAAATADASVGTTAMMADLLEDNAEDAKNRVGGRDFKVREKWERLSPDLREALRTMSVGDMDADTVREVCALYAVDVALMRHLGFGAPLCDNAVAAAAAA